MTPSKACGQSTQRYDGAIKKERRRKGHTLSAIKRVIEKRKDVTLSQLRSAGKEIRIMRARRVIALTAKEYGFPGKEIAVYSVQDPTPVSGHSHGEDTGMEADTVVNIFSERR